jgi:hypothetical protein
MIYSARQFTLTDRTFVAEASDLGINRTPTEIYLGHLGQVLRFVYVATDRRDGEIVGWNYQEVVQSRDRSLAHKPRFILLIND